MHSLSAQSPLNACIFVSVRVFLFLIPSFSCLLPENSSAAGLRNKSERGISLRKKERMGERPASTTAIMSISAAEADLSLNDWMILETDRNRHRNMTIHAHLQSLLSIPLVLQLPLLFPFSLPNQLPYSLKWKIREKAIGNRRATRHDNYMLILSTKINDRW